MILSRKHEYSVGNVRCAFAITAGVTLEHRCSCNTAFYVIAL